MSRTKLILFIFLIICFSLSASLSISPQSVQYIYAPENGSDVKYYVSISQKVDVGDWLIGYKDSYGNLKNISSSVVGTTLSRTKEDGDLIKEGELLLTIGEAKVKGVLIMKDREIKFKFHDPAWVCINREAVEVKFISETNSGYIFEYLSDFLSQNDANKLKIVSDPKGCDI
ncbi:hypothetical protein ACFOEE_12045 [Pseudoalteromonas fenneropenaei]|uniref:Uncharacterized protein n=1 Tax=Pseudoalteromonas fenneropenaei TaxID=1737459 RepID=A0ABV7CKT1_9GAMM